MLYTFSTAPGMCPVKAAGAGKVNLKANDSEDVDLVLEEIAEQNDQMIQIQDALAHGTMAGVDEADQEAKLDVRLLLAVVARCRSRMHAHIQSNAVPI
jgi:hypothetical protein